MFVAPIAGLLSRPDRLAAADGRRAWRCRRSAIGWLADGHRRPTVAYAALVLPFVMAGTGMALVFAPAANAVLGAVRPEEAGQASGATNAIRELGGVLGVAVLASVFARSGGYASPQAFVDGLTAALPVGAAVLAAGALLGAAGPGPTARGSAEPRRALARGAAAAERQQPQRQKAGDPARLLPGRRLRALHEVMDRAPCLVTSVPGAHAGAAPARRSRGARRRPLKAASFRI